MARVQGWSLWQSWFPQDDHDGIARAQRIRSGARACCSCWMCGNPRKWNAGKTKEALSRAEHLAAVRARDED